MLKTIRLSDKSGPGKNNDSKSIFSKNNDNRLAFKKKNGNSEFNIFGGHCMKHVKKSKKLKG